MVYQQTNGRVEVVSAVSSPAIVAVATASGYGAVGVVRISGIDLYPLACFWVGHTCNPRHAYLRIISDRNENPIDECIVLWFPSPHSFTGEDVIELQGHGGPVALQALVQHAFDKLTSLGINARIAKPGEFTERAFLNGKIDLLKAEAVADLINATSTAAAASAAKSLVGGFSREVGLLADQLLEIRKLVEACLDFPEEEDTNLLQEYGVVDKLDKLIEQQERVLTQTQQGALLFEGVKIAIVGQPNVGKSALLNRLAEAEVAIVSDQPGTTRDKIEKIILLMGLQVQIIDTAGIRDTDDKVEKLGIQKTRQTAADADVVVFLRDLSRKDHEEYILLDQRIEDELEGLKVLEVWNKLDLYSSWQKNDEKISVSAETGQGIEQFRQKLASCIGWSGVTEGVWMARARHVYALENALQYFKNAKKVIISNAQEWGWLAEELRLAQKELGALTGDVDSDELLGEIFRSFCIGK